VTQLRCTTLLKACLALVLSSVVTLASAISYTVQVVALSDQEAALALQRRLISEGYPVYLISVQTESGSVYRLRVGAFANRNAAVSFASAMGTVDGATPAPALAEGIPQGLIPLEPELLASYPHQPGTTRLELIPWGDGEALRFQSRAEGEVLQAEYRILTPELVKLPFGAWRAVPDPQNPTAESLWRVRNFLLWPPNFAELSDAERDAYEDERLFALSASFGLSSQALRAYRFQPAGSSAPYIVLAERLNLTSSEQRRFPALGDPNAALQAHGPELVWLEGEAPEGFPDGLPEPRFDPAAALGDGLASGNRLELDGNGWSAIPDDSYTKLRLHEAGRSWRAVAGYPLWASEDFLLVYDEDAFKLYQFWPR
jgi:hypothetical protein